MEGMTQKTCGMHWNNVTYYINTIIRNMQLITCSELIHFTVVHAAVLLKIHLIYLAILI